MDPLCRPLTLPEQAWLAQSSLISLVGQVHTLNKDTLISAVSTARSRNPYLNVAINTTELKYERNETIPITSETMDTLFSQESIHTIVQHQLTIGVDRTVSLAKCHLVTYQDTQSLLVICDHLCFDGKSAMTLFQSICNEASNEAKATTNETRTQIEMLEFINWTDNIPTNISFETAYQPPFETMRIKPKEDIASSTELATMNVSDVIVTLPADLFLALKVKTKEQNTTLNAPLMAAFLAAAGDVAVQRNATDYGTQKTYQIRSVCAVDVRGKLNLSDDYMNNSAGVVPVHATFQRDTTNVDALWQSAIAAQNIMIQNIENNEAYRLNDITNNQRFNEFPGYFDIIGLWSNMGMLRCNDGVGVNNLEVHLAGSAANPIVSGHPITNQSDGRCNLTLTYSSGFHSKETIAYWGERFLLHVGTMCG